VDVMTDRIAFVLFVTIVCGGLGIVTVAMLAVAVRLFRHRR